MASAKKKVAVILIFLIGLVVVETGRELTVFLSWSKYYEKAYWRIDARRFQEDPITKSELVEIAGQPSSKSNTGIESWYWDSGKHVGPVLRLIHLPLTRKPYQLSVEFGPEGFVKDVYANAE